MDKASFINAFKNKTLDITNYLEQEFIKLNYKVSKCCYECFDKEKLQEALSCEAECRRSTENAYTYLRSQEKSATDKFETCKMRVEQVVEGRHFDENLAGQGYNGCLETFFHDIENLQKEMSKEFQYYK